MDQKASLSNQETALPAPAKKSNLHLASFIPHGLPRVRVHLSVGLRHFIRDYSLPLIVTIIVVVLLAVAWIARLSERATLAGLLLGAPSSGQDYGTLLSRDKTSAPTRDDTNDPQAATAEQTNSTANTAQIAPTQSSGAATSANTAPAPGGGSTTPLPFSASIASFQQDSVVLECSSAKQNKGSCYKKYTFSANVRSQNGPGSVSYGWRSNLAGTGENGSFSVSSGSSSTTLQKQITIACTTAGSYTMQIVLTSPAPAQSPIISFTHNCNDI